MTRDRVLIQGSQHQPDIATSTGDHGITQGSRDNPEIARLIGDHGINQGLRDHPDIEIRTCDRKPVDRCLQIRYGPGQG